MTNGVPDYIPTPEEIKAETAKIRAEWDERERQERLARQNKGLSHGCDEVNRREHRTGKR